MDGVQVAYEVHNLQGLFVEILIGRSACKLVDKLEESNKAAFARALVIDPLADDFAKTDNDVQIEIADSRVMSLGWPSVLTQIVTNEIDLL
jgi:hypothetical protein